MSKEKKLVDKIRYHKALYYKGVPEISDQEYDKLENELRILNSDHPVLSMVGSKPTSGAKVEHGKKMLSLNKTYSIEDLKKWIGSNETISMHKIDGVSGSIIYVDGKLSLAKTRGDGVVGENITESVKWMDSVPSQLDTNESFEVRGEIYCTEKDFLNLAQEMEERGLSKPTSQRNIVAGLISRKEHLELTMSLSFMAFDILGDQEKIQWEVQKFQKLQSLGFTCPEIITHRDEHDAVEERVKDLETFVEEGEYQIDGLVFTYNDLKKHRELGETSHHPKYKMAFKQQGDVERSKIKEIAWGVSRNGVLTPVAMIEPVELSGAMISRVTLHNLGIVKIHNLKVGDKIEIIRSGEVIPKFLRVIENAEGEIEIPASCPSCGKGLREIDIRLVCENMNCSEKKIEGILYYLQKIGVDDVSTKRVKQFIDAGLVRDIPDLYLLTVENLLGLESFKEKLANKIITSIQKSKEVTLLQFLTALGLSGGATNKIEKIINSGYTKLEDFLEMDTIKLISVESFAEKSADEFLKSLAAKKELIEHLIECGVKITDAEKKKEGNLSGKKVCITGTLSERRSVIEERIKNAGGYIVSSVSKKTDYLLTNEVNGTSSKYKKATLLGIEIVNEDKMKAIIDN